MSGTGDGQAGHQGVGGPDARTMTEDEWRASLATLAPSSGVGLGQPSSASPTAPVAAPSVAPFSTQLGTGSWGRVPTTSSTRWVWWLVILPLLVFAALFALVLGQGSVLSASGPMSFEAMLTVLLGWLAVLFTIPLLQLAASVWLAYGDRRALAQLGHRETASPWWNLLSPLVYLILRTVHAHRATGGGSAPLTAFVCLYIIPGVVLGVVAAVTSQGA